MKLVIKILLVISIAVLGYLCVMSIMTPINFEETRKLRESAVIARLIDIRKAQNEYKNLNGRYVSTLDSLVDFVKTGRMPIVMKMGELSDFQLEQGLTEKKALRIIASGKKKEIEQYGLQNFRRDTVFINVIDTIYKKGFVADSLPFIPGTTELLEMRTATLPSASGIPISVFEVRAPYDIYLKGLDRQEIINLKDRAIKLEKYPGMQVGSIEIANNAAGNWE